MSQTFFSRLLETRSIDGRVPTPQDYLDAIRCVCDQHCRYAQLGDDFGQAAAFALLSQLRRAAGQTPAVPY